MVKVNDWDEPLFPLSTKPRRKSTTRPEKRTFRAHSGKPVTCHVCIISVARGIPLTGQRELAKVVVTEPDGQVWMLCEHHAKRVKDGLLALPFDPPERGTKK